LWASDEQVGKVRVGDFPAKRILEVKFSPDTLAHPFERIGSKDREFGKNGQCRDDKREWLLCDGKKDQDAGGEPERLEGE
jgi:hypothetical protein